MWDSYPEVIKEQQERPNGDYAICHVGEDELDMLDKSYDDGISENIKFMVPKEGIISAFRYRTETGKMYDVKGLTRFAALDSDGDAINMCRISDGRFHIDNEDCDYRYCARGLRQVSF